MRLQYSPHLVRFVVVDRRDAVSLMDRLARYGSFLVEPDADHWIVHARCREDEVEDVVRLIEAWQSARSRDPDLLVV